MTSIHSRPATAAFPIWPGDAPGSEGWQQQELEAQSDGIGIRVVRNVARPTLTAYLPDAARATGTAAVVCPGGAFHFLAIEHEGTQVASWLNARGIAAFVLRYRLVETPPADDDFRQAMAATFADRDQLDAQIAPVKGMVIADGLQALRVVRQRAAEWGVAPERTGIMGFSAGGYVAAGAALRYDAASRPSFAAPIYPAPIDSDAAPPDAPPLFLAMASDDEMAVGASLPLLAQWRAAGRPAELHIYAAGGHGFGMNTQGLPSDAWIERFGEWLASQGMLG